MGENLIRQNRKPSLQELQVFGFMMQNPTSDFYGLEIMKGAGVLAGSLYPLLARWEQRGWVSSDWENIDEKREGRRRRRYYHLTPDGLSYAKRVIEHETKAFAKVGMLSQ